MQNYDKKQRNQVMRWAITIVALVVIGTMGVLQHWKNQDDSYARYLIKHKCTRLMSEFNGKSFNTFQCDTGNFALEDIQAMAGVEKP